MPLYTDPGYSYYSGGSSGGSLYSPYYSTPLYGSSSSSSNAYAPYASAYNRSYIPPPAPRSTQYSALVSRYHPKLSTITESPLTSRGNFIPLTRIQSPKISTYTPTLASKYIPIRTARPRTINTADIDVSASSRYGRHHHMADRRKEEEKAEAEAEAAESQSASNADSDTSSGIVDPNSPFMPRVDGTDTAHHARSTIKRNRAVVRLSMMRPRSRDDSKGGKSSAKSSDIAEPQVIAMSPEPAATKQSDQLEKFHILDKAKEEGIQVTVTDMAQSQITETSLNEVIIEVDPVTHTVRRLSIPLVPSFHDICEDISSDKIDDDLNAGELRRRASLIQEQEIEIINELQKSQSGSFQVIHLDPNVHQDDGRKSRKSKKTKKIRHKITANVAIENSSPTALAQPTSNDDSTASPTLMPKFTFNVEDIEEHKIFKLPKKRTTSIKSKKSDDSSKATQAAAMKPGPPDKVSKVEESQMKVATPKPIIRIEKSDSGEDFWSQIESRETLYMNKRRKSIDKTGEDESILSLTEQKTTTAPSDIEAVSSPIKQKSKLQDKTPAVTEGPRKDEQQPTTPKKVINKPPNLENIQKVEHLKKDEQKPSTPKKLANKSHDSPKTKNPPKLAAKKKSSPKNDAKEETVTPETSLKSKTKPSTPSPTTTTANKDSIASPKINVGSSPKSPEKKKISSNTDTTATKQSITKNAVQDEVTSKGNDKKIPEISTKTVPPWMTELKTMKQELQKSPTPPLTKLVKSADTSEISTNFTTAKSNSKSTETICDTATKKLTTSPNESDVTSPLHKQKQTASLTKPESPIVTSPSPMTSTTTSAIVSTVQVATPKPISTSTIATPTATTASPSLSSTSATTTVADSSTVLGNSGNNNLSKFTTISNLAQCLQDVDADLEDYIPSSAEETDSSSDSYIEDGSLSASMKKKNKQLRKKAKQEQQGFDPNKKIKIDTKKKCYVKEEAPRYPLIATPRPLWKREKVVYEESSNSSSEETETDSECTTSDEYEDELSPKDAIIRMSTCSNDSGFDGGTAPSSSKKALDCDVNCHKKCEKLTANLCGVKQKLIVEALACVKRGAQEARDSPCSPLSLNPAYKIEANDDETSYTYLQFQKSGRITAPATSIPRFKKYSVEDFHFLAVLGKGSFGKVLLAELRNTDFYYAVKCLKKDVVLEDDDVECTLIERKVLALGTKHPYLCHLFCTFQTESHLFFVMEYLNGGDLMFHIQESGRFPEDRAQFYGAEIISGLKFLHKKGIIYRDLKLDNVLLDFDGHVRIADFGMCKLQIYLDKTADSFCGTPDYMAPEIIKGDKYNQNVDWWSFGVLLYEMLIGQSPFSGCDEDELFWSICNEIPWFPVYITKEATSILKGLLEKDYTRRVGSQYSPAGDICDHIFFKSIDWGLLEKRQIPPPFKPQVKHPLDTQYFDRAFTRERVRLTPIDKEILQSMDQEQFQGFSYTNPNATLD